jgi:hypothetical protein
VVGLAVDGVAVALAAAVDEVRLVAADGDFKRCRSSSIPLYPLFAWRIGVSDTGSAWDFLIPVLRYFCQLCCRCGGMA